MSLFILVHSPLCGPGTWHATAQALRVLGHDTIVPSFTSNEANPTPLWQHQAHIIAQQLKELDAQQPLIWVGHSGAGLRYFDEPIPVPAKWPDAPCAFLHFSQSYNADAAYAIDHNWAYQKIEAGHFYMLVDPVGTARAIVNLKLKI